MHYCKTLAARCSTRARLLAPLRAMITCLAHAVGLHQGQPELPHVRLLRLQGPVLRVGQVHKALPARLYHGLGQLAQPGGHKGGGPGGPGGRAQRQGAGAGVGSGSGKATPKGKGWQQDVGGSGGGLRLHLW